MFKVMQICNVRKWRSEFCRQKTYAFFDDDLKEDLAGCVGLTLPLEEALLLLVGTIT
jgi:hypothetical protein